MIVLGLVIALVGLSLATDLPDMPALAPEAGLWMAIGGGIALLAGLLGLAYRAILARRNLPSHRYRGPSIILLFIIVLAVGNLASVVFLPQLLGDAPADPAVLGGVLFLTPIAFLLVTWSLVLRPGAIIGLRLSDGPGTPRNVGRGSLLGIGVWLAAAVTSVVAVSLWSLLIGDPPETQQYVFRLLEQAPPLAAFLGAGLLGPVAEEIFFRGVAFNAWEREYGRGRAIVGSSILFGAVHMLDGAVLAFPPILMVGLLLAIAYDRTRSLPLVMAAHAIFNIISLTLFYTAGAM